MTSDAIEEVTDFIAFLRESIEHEEQSHARYMNAARFVQSDDERQILHQLAEEELRHRDRLEDILAGWLTRQDVELALGS